MNRTTPGGNVNPRALIYVGLLAAMLATGLPSPLAAAGGEGARPAVSTGEVRFVATRLEAQVPKHLRLAAHRFTYRERPLAEVSPVLAISFVTFPSPVVTPHPNNNTVHCEYFRPKGEGPFPGVVVLHILGGDFELSRVFCNSLAHEGVAALLVKMPYYGPRRQPGVARRMISHDPRETVAGMTQAVLDIRRAAAWLASRKEVDEDQLGVFGISLGGITAALAAAAEPRFKNICLMLAGGDLGRIAWDSPRVADLRRRWEAQGGTRQTLIELYAQIDPVTYAKNLKGRRVLMLNATRDRTIPRACTESLWKALGRPRIIWYNANHYSIARYIFDGMHQVDQFFRPLPAEQ